MRAIVAVGSGGPEVLQLMQRDDPQPGPGEVRVKVMACGVNPADILQRKGHYPAPVGYSHDILGLEFAGCVDQVGPNTSGFLIGERVFGLTGGGAYADYVVVPALTLSKIPDCLDFTEAAGVPEAFITAYDAIVTQGCLKKGETLLVNGVAGGVGTAALQIAKAIGAITIGTSRSEAKLKRAKDYGLDYGVVPINGVFSRKVLDIFSGYGPQVILELVGGSYVKDDIEVAAQCGRILLVGLPAGHKLDIDLGQLLSKRLLLRGTTLRARPIDEKIQVAKSFAENVLPLISKRMLRPVIDKVIPLSEAASAHRYLESNQSFGKVVLKLA